MIRRMMRPTSLLINRRLGIEQTVVQAQHASRSLDQGALNSFLLGVWLRFCFPNHESDNTRLRAAASNLCVSNFDKFDHRPRRPRSYRTGTVGARSLLNNSSITDASRGNSNE